MILHHHSVIASDKNDVVYDEDTDVDDDDDDAPSTNVVGFEFQPMDLKALFTIRIKRKKIKIVE